MEFQESCQVTVKIRIDSALTHKKGNFGEVENKSLPHNLGNRKKEKLHMLFLTPHPFLLQRQIQTKIDNILSQAEPLPTYILKHAKQSQPSVTFYFEATRFDLS